MRKIKILALTNGSGVGYHRVLKPMKALEQLYPDDYEIYYVHVKNKDIANLPSLSDYSFDFIYFNTILGIDDDSPLLYYLETVLTRGAKIVLDIDDYFEFGRSVIVKKSVGEKHAELIPDAIKAADYITTTTERYAERLIELNPNVSVFPNFADEYDPQYAVNKTFSDKIRIGVTGSVMHKYDVEILRGIPYLLKKKGIIKNIQFVLCGYAPNIVYQGYEKVLTDEYRTVSRRYRQKLQDNIDLLDVDNANEPYRRIGWRDIDSYMTVYNEIDILLAPLENTRFNSAKSQIKYIEAGYMDTLFIGSNVPSYNQYISNGETGFLCNGRSDFLDFITRVVENWDDEDGFRDIRDNAKKDVCSRFTKTPITANRNEFFKSLIL